MLVRFVLLLCVIHFAAAPLLPQTNKSRQTDPPPEPSLPDFREEPGQNLSLPEEMRVKMLIERRESEYKKVVQNVDKLASQVATSFHKQGHLVAEDLKKVGVIEKLAHQVLNHAGGEGVDDKDLKPTSIAEAIDKMSEAATRIKKDVTAETRFVVSATVIASSNEVINLARLIRKTQKN
jgi:hypothetical protein